MGPTCRTHCKKASKRLYVLRALKKVNVPNAAILKVYLTTVTPTLEYGVQVWQNIPQCLSYKLEALQKRALCIIYPAPSYDDALKLANISSVAVRRIELCDKYLEKIHMKGHPINFLVNKTPAGTTHNYSLRPRAASRRNSSACRTLRSSSFITL